MAKKRSVEEENGPLKKRPSSQILGISRSISACQRCRLKKVKCDQNFPSCSKCEKAKVQCIGLDPATGRQVPRSYIIHLEDRIAALEQKLKDTGVDPERVGTVSLVVSQELEIKEETEETEEKEQNLMMNEVKFNTINTTNNRHISTNLSISFAKLMSTAVKFKDRKSNFSNTPDIELDPTTLTSNSKDIKPALLPPKKTAQEFLKVFFALSNSQLPVLHREEFLKNCFLPVYGKLDSDISLASNYTAINLTQIENDPYYKDESLTWFYQYKKIFNEKLNNYKQQNIPVDPISISNEITPPIKYHKALYFLNMVFSIASSTHHLQYPSTISDSFKLAANKFVDQVYGSHDQLESLQGILLLAVYSIMRPSVPGCWYVVGSALRLCIDLGLHSETLNQTLKVDSFTLDKRRRLFWCTYSLDRQICFYLTRPVGIPDSNITTPFPSEIDDALIIPHDSNNMDYSKNNSGISSYKTISISMFKIRKIQSEVQRILFSESELPRQFGSLAEWKKHILKLLNNWKNTSPKTRRKMNCDFNLDFFGLNYNHTMLALHGLSPKNFKLNQQDFFKVAESSKELINIYTLLLQSKSINYTWAAVLNLFMAGTSYLYTIYNSEPVRVQNSLFEVKKITQECITVLNSLVDRCEAALDCTNTFEVLTAAVVKLKYNETVHGNTRIPSNIKFSNGNLNKLVENLKSHEEQEEVGITPEAVSYNQSTSNQNEFDTFTMKLENDLNPFTIDGMMTQNVNIDQLVDQPEKPITSTYLNNHQAGSEFLGFKSPSTFEWTSESKVYENDLDSFFNELEKSPLSTNSRRNSFSDAELNVMTNTAMNRTPHSYDSNNSTESSPIILNNSINPYQRHSTQMGPPETQEYNGVPSKDGRKVFELLHQVPVDQIWDQFFTTNANSSNFGLDP